MTSKKPMDEGDSALQLSLPFVSADDSLSGRSNLLIGDVLEVIKDFPDCHFDAILCDPPYHLTQNYRNGSPQPGDAGKTPFGRHGVGTDKGFMGQTWDGGDIAFRRETWVQILRVMKPGAYLMAFGGTRTFHRMMVAMEDAGLIIMDTMMYLRSRCLARLRECIETIL